jgi:glycosyltransferase involved in cell wall biosynthesis
VTWIPYPVDSPPEIVRNWEQPRDELVLGFCGRIQSPQKRVERLPEIARALKAAGVTHRWEILGTGPAQAALQREFETVGSGARFHGVQSGDAYWRHLAEWDAIVFTSDYEGLPIALLEAQSQGVVPVFPDLDNGGRDYTRKVAPELIYPHADVEGAAAALRWLKAQPMETRRALSTRARDAAAPHGHDAYGRTFANFVTAMANEPRIAMKGPSARRAHRGEWLPFGMLGRLKPSNPLRRGYV